MPEQRLNLASSHVKVLGNRNDVHVFRLNNPAGQTIINVEGIYVGEFKALRGQVRTVELDVSQISSGVLSFPLIVDNGVYEIRRTNPQRTILTAEVQVR